MSSWICTRYVAANFCSLACSTFLMTAASVSAGLADVECGVSSLMFSLDGDVDVYSFFIEHRTHHNQRRAERSWRQHAFLDIRSRWFSLCVHRPRLISLHKSARGDEIAVPSHRSLSILPNPRNDAHAFFRLMPN